MIINDDLIGGVLVLACLFAGLISGIIIALIANYSFNNTDWFIWALIAFCIGYGLTLCIMITVRAGVATLFVCWANDPFALQQTKPREYNVLVNAWKQRYGGFN